MVYNELSSFMITRDICFYTNLAKTKLIVDAWLICDLYIYSSNGYELTFNGNYDRIANIARKMLFKFKKCAIEPIFVFECFSKHRDNMDQNYYKNMIGRVSTILKLESEYEFSAFNDYIAPLRCFEVLKGVLGEHGIRAVFSSDYDTHIYMTTLANELNCPTFSNKSELFTYRCIKGNAMYNGEETNASLLDDDADCFQVMMYDMDVAAEKLNLSCRRDLAIVYGLLGMNLSKQATCQLLDEYTKIVRTASSSEGSTINNVAYRLRMSKENQQKLTINVGRILFPEQPKMAAENENNIRRNHVGDESLPEWFRQAARNDEMPYVAQMVAAYRHNKFRIQIEDLDTVSAQRCSEAIRRVFYGIIVSGRATPIMERDREYHKTMDYSIVPVTTLDEYGPLPTLATIPELSITMKRDLVYATLGLQMCEMETVAAEHQLYVAITKFWFRNTPASRAQLDALLVYAIKTMAETKLTNGEEPKRYFETVLTGLRCHPAIKSRYYHSAQIQVQRQHVYSQWNACFEDVVNLNLLLQKPFPNPEIQRYYSGVYIYAYSQEPFTMQDKLVNEFGDELNNLYEQFLDVII